MQTNMHFSSSNIHSRGKGEGFKTKDVFRMDERRKAGFVCLSVMNKGRRAGERGKVPSGVLLTTMCAGDGDLASLSACLL